MSRAAVSRTKRRYRQRYPEVPVGDGVVSASVESVLAAIRAVDPDLPWDSVADALVPVFPRRRAMPHGMDEAVTLVRPPGLRVGIGVDIGPAFMYVVDGLLRGWGVTAEAALERAIANVRALCTKRRLDPVTQGQIGDVPTTWFQSGEGIASALLLLPDQMARRLGPEPQLVIAPMRDLLVSIPLDAGVEFGAWLRESIAEEDPLPGPAGVLAGRWRAADRDGDFGDAASLTGSGGPTCAMSGPDRPRRRIAWFRTEALMMCY